MGVPEGALSPADSLLFPVTNTGLVAHTTLDQATVEALLKQRWVLDNPSIQNPVEALYDGFRRGFSFAQNVFEQLLQNASDDVTQVFDNAADALTATRDFFSGKWTSVDSAAETAAYAAAQQRVEGRLIVDRFDEAAGAPSSSWDIRHIGGGGSARYDGAGHLVWSASGGVAASDRMRWADADTTTDYQVISTVMSLRPASPFAGGNSYVYLCGRVNTGFDTFCTGRISFGGAVLLGFISDTATILASNPVTVGNGDTWDFYPGDPIAPDPYKFVLVRNGVPVITIDDSNWDGAPTPLSTVTQYGAGMRSVGLIMHAADRALNTAQTSPGALVVFSADDQ
ncbi:hypothetical protein ORI20_14115 [Mycobacterium sp. CVI_P3]|uniref:DUF7257 domain-containing protein n=1 Tax=Mycobacterium pinniadriaticum TaxID=2994102 RepID=A0ABT3SG14_9MYCO|nr:hypothetical protein [Mycobacterium pinniadriaticum]MCX2931416.1 hypothetical protein [Mycobacterium pinniadriaticum]MCX2937840.1 hypothetical protein [Mycobacterium pinniadriaticum]